MSSYSATRWRPEAQRRCVGISSSASSPAWACWLAGRAGGRWDREAIFLSDDSAATGDQAAYPRTGGDVEMVASPLPYLFDEEKRGDRQTREALFCTFNADLAFFERTVLG